MSNFVPKITRWVSKELTICECPESRKTLIFQGFLGHHKNFLHLFDTIRRSGASGTAGRAAPDAGSGGARSGGDFYRGRRHRPSEVRRCVPVLRRDARASLLPGKADLPELSSPASGGNKRINKAAAYKAYAAALFVYPKPCV